MKLFVLLMIAGLIAGCSQTAEKIEAAANRSSTSWAQGKPYSQVAALGNRPLDQLSTEPVGFGQLIGQSSLADGTTVYRHIAPAAKTTSSSDFAGLVGTQKEVTNFRLSYFKVGQNGVVQDWATGSVPGSISDCVSYIAGIFQKCTDQGRVKQALAVYDSIVRTSTGSPMTSWGPPVVALTNQIVQ
ncbi:MAG: hypothetical protein AAF423_12325 [Pseudomonadota bacterium]